MPTLTGMLGITGSTIQPQPGGKPNNHHAIPPNGSSISQACIIVLLEGVIVETAPHGGGFTLYGRGGLRRAHVRSSAQALPRGRGAVARGACRARGPEAS